MDSVGERGVGSTLLGMLADVLDVFRLRQYFNAVALPLFIRPVQSQGLHWQDGGIVDIFPVHPLLDIEEPRAFTLAINGFYPPDFEGEDASGWQQLDDMEATCGRRPRAAIGRGLPVTSEHSHR